MKRNIKTSILIISIFFLFGCFTKKKTSNSSVVTNMKKIKEHQFKHPDKPNCIISLKHEEFKSMTKEKRGGDYYYLSDISKIDKNDIIYSILFYKLNSEEKESLIHSLIKVIKETEKIDLPKDSPIFPLTYFTTNAKLTPYETNAVNSGGLKDDFMYKQTDIKMTIEDQEISQKHMYAFSTFNDEIFVQIHLSKENCSKQDSVVMKTILDKFSKKQF